MANLNQIMESIATDLYYQPGEAIAVTGRFAGICTGGSQSLFFSTVLPKSLAGVDNTSIVVDDVVGGVRIVSGGYVDGVADGTSWMNRTGITVSGEIFSNNSIVITIHKTSTFKAGTTSTAVTNNTPVVIGGTISFHFTS